jgi:hypothetical protein
MYANLPKLIAKDFSVADLIELMGQGSGGGRRDDSPTANVLPQEINFSDLLGNQAQSESLSHETSALEHNPSPESPDFPSLEPGLESLIESSPREGESVVG